MPNEARVRESADRILDLFLNGNSQPGTYREIVERELAAIASLPAQEPQSTERGTNKDADDWSCGTCGDRDVPDKFRVFGSCYKCAAARSVSNRDRKISQLKAALSATPTGGGKPATPAARWRAEGKPDPIPQDYERAALPLGQYTDDELANAAYLTVGHIPEHLSNAAKQRMRWLSRRLCEAEERLAAIDALPVTSDAQPSPSSTAPEPVTWRWRPPGAQSWIYNPDIDWLEEHRHEIEAVPLYTAPPLPDREAIALTLINETRSHHGLEEIGWDFPALSSGNRRRALRQADAILKLIGEK